MTPARGSVWQRPRALGYHETLRGLGGIVAPLLAGFSLAAIATIVTGQEGPPMADWAVAAFAAAVAFLLFSMQVAFESLRQNSSPEDVLAWRPEATVSENELHLARKAQAADFGEMTRLGRLSLNMYGAGLIAFLLGVLLLMIPEDWSVAWVIGVAVTAGALALEAWWLAANRWRRLPHPVARDINPTHAATWTGDPPPLDRTGLAAVIDPGRRAAAGLAPPSEP
jgi:hypothetical protein